MWSVATRVMLSPSITRCPQNGHGVDVGNYPHLHLPRTNEPRSVLSFAVNAAFRAQHVMYAAFRLHAVRTELVRLEGGCYFVTRLTARILAFANNQRLGPRQRRLSVNTNLVHKKPRKKVLTYGRPYGILLSQLLMGREAFCLCERLLCEQALPPL